MPFQIHSPDAIAITELWPPDARPRCDALVTATPGLALGVTGADCGMILFADQRARVIGAAHAGWKGALTGVVEATVDGDGAARRQARRHRRRAWPLHRRQILRGRPGVRRRLRRRGRRHGALFHRPAAGRATRCSTSTPISPSAPRARESDGFEDLRLDTYADERRFFSYRRATHRQGAGLRPADVGHRHELSRGREFRLLDRLFARDQLRPQIRCLPIGARSNAP